MHTRTLLLLLLASCATAADVRGGSAAPHVRLLEPSMVRLLEAGESGSRTFKRLVDRLDGSDVIVHVAHRRPAAGESDGALWFVTRAAGHRYLRIVIDGSLPRNQAIALLAHELQHAVEVADAAWVGDAVSFESLYRRIGEPCRSSRRFDTAAARRVASVVLAELRGAPARRYATLGR